MEKRPEVQQPGMVNTVRKHTEYRLEILWIYGLERLLKSLLDKGLDRY